VFSQFPTYPVTISGNVFEERSGVNELTIQLNAEIPHIPAIYDAVTGDFQDTITLSDGVHTITERADDIAGNVAIPHVKTVVVCIDADQDGYSSTPIVDCEVNGFLDCNDANSAAYPGAPDNNCDGIDNDCDGTPDDDYLTTPTTCGVGECAGNTGELTCVNGQEEDSCNPFQGAAPADTLCDGLDNDCDGPIDEDYVSTPTTCGVGACAGNSGELICEGGSETNTCDPFQGAAPDDTLCNNIDDDCDGPIDEDYITTPTTCGTGACAANGDLVCQAGSEVDTCVEGDPTPEVCNNIDDDCDGPIDENEAGGPLTQACYDGPPNTEGVGICTGGTETCTEGSYGECVGQQLPEAEGPPGDASCSDGFDNDCDGLTDLNDPDCVVIPVDTDGDGVPDDQDKCTDPATVLPEGVPTLELRPNHYAQINPDIPFEVGTPGGGYSTSSIDLYNTFGCSCEQILECKPGNNNGEYKFGCTEGTMNVWTTQTGWSTECLVNGQVTEGESKPILEDTDANAVTDPLDPDNDGDGIPDAQDSEPESQPLEAGKQGTGKPDWWCDKHPAKC
jgi:hypothetical protein